MKTENRLLVAESDGDRRMENNCLKDVELNILLVTMAQCYEDSNVTEFHFKW